jgi:hypothetical protein
MADLAGNFMAALVGHFIKNGIGPPTQDTSGLMSDASNPNAVISPASGGSPMGMTQPQQQPPTIIPSQIPKGPTQAQDTSTPAGTADTAAAVAPDPQSPDVPDPYTAAQNLGQMGGTNPGMFDTSQMAMNDAQQMAPMVDPNSTTSNIGRALSGVQMPSSGGNGNLMPSAPSVPGIHPVDSNLFALLQAAGLTAAAPQVGMALGRRLG